MMKDLIKYGIGLALTAVGVGTAVSSLVDMSREVGHKEGYEEGFRCASKTAYGLFTDACIYHHGPAAAKQMVDETIEYGKKVTK